ncbi:MAG: type-F conjugative transfer system pilin assembly protein TrbC [Pseudomonadota bacterium]
MASISAGLLFASPVVAFAREQSATQSHRDDAHESDAYSGDIAAETRKMLRALAGEGAAAAKAEAQEDNQITSRAKATAEAVYSEAFQALIGEMGPGVLAALGVEDGAVAAADSQSPPRERPEFSTLVFASSSMPMPTLRAYAAQLETIGGAIILRGGVGGLSTMGPTIDFIMEVLKRDAACDGPQCDMRDVSVLIDPILFAQAGVARVPAVAIVDHDPFVSYCERDTEDARGDRWTITYGDAALSGHFDELARLGEGRAHLLLARLENKEARRAE